MKFCNIRKFVLEILTSFIFVFIYFLPVYFSNTKIKSSVDHVQDFTLFCLILNLKKIANSCNGTMTNAKFMEGWWRGRIWILPNRIYCEKKPYKDVIFGTALQLRDHNAWLEINVFINGTCASVYCFVFCTSNIFSNIIHG